MGSTFRGPVGFTPAESRIAAVAALLVLSGLVYTAVERLSHPAPPVHLEIYRAPMREEPVAFGAEADDSAHISLPSGSWIDGRLDVNLADYADLLRLSGVGPVLAGRIIDYRDRHGPFTAVDSLINVAGIGNVKLDKLRPHICIRETGD